MLFVARGVPHAPFWDATPASRLMEDFRMDCLTYTVTEAAALLGISRTTAYECVRRGEIPSLTLGRRVVISRVALERMLDGGLDHEVAASR